MSSWTDIKITVPLVSKETAESIATAAAHGGIYTEDYSDLEKQARDIAHIDLIDEELLKKDRQHAIIHVYVSSEEDPREVIDYLHDRLTLAGVEYSLNTDISRNEDWENNWKQYFHSMKIGSRLLIHPIWEDLPEDTQGRAVLDIEPGLAFGTGNHETTRLCLEQLENHITPETRVLDVGCGSGILSIASLILGAKEAVAVDIDPLAVKTAEENARLSSLPPERYHVILGDITKKVSGRFDLILANIVADVIIRMLPDLPAFMENDAVFICSGIIGERGEEVFRALEEHGFDVISRHEDKGWLCFVCGYKR